MANVREGYWIPRLRRLVKKMIRQRHGCKRYQAVALEVLPQGLFPLERTQGSGAFEVDGVDFTGPIMTASLREWEGKAYLLFYACGLTRALYLELILFNLETTTFLRSLKRFIARRG